MLAVEAVKRSAQPCVGALSARPSSRTSRAMSMHMHRGRTVRGCPPRGFSCTFQLLRLLPACWNEWGDCERSRLVTTVTLNQCNCASLKKHKLLEIAIQLALSSAKLSNKLHLVLNIRSHFQCGLITAISLRAQ